MELLFLLGNDFVRYDPPPPPPIHPRSAFEVVNNAIWINMLLTLNALQ